MGNTARKHHRRVQRTVAAKLRQAVAQTRELPQSDKLQLLVEARVLTPEEAAKAKHDLEKSPGD
jgi:hypothetical protein